MSLPHATPGRLRGALIAGVLGAGSLIAILLVQWAVMGACRLALVGEDYTWITLTMLLFPLLATLTGLSLRCFVRREYTCERVTLATPGFYWGLCLCVLLPILMYATAQEQVLGVFLVGLLGLGLSWPFTAAAFVLRNGPDDGGPHR